MTNIVGSVYMKIVKSKQIAQTINKNRINLIVTLIFLFIGILFMAWAFLFHRFDNGNTKFLHDMMAEGKAYVGEKAKIEVFENPYVFAEYESNKEHGKYYFLMDEKYLYIGYLNNKTFSELSSSDIGENPIIVKGITKDLTDDVISLAIEVYNEQTGEDFLTRENYKQYIGEVYLDTVDSGFNGLYLMVGIISLIPGSVLGYSYWQHRKQFNKVMNSYTDTEWQLIEKELESTNTNTKLKVPFYLTENYIVDISNGLDIIKYSDIVWIYSYQIKQYGMIVKQSLIVYTKDGNKHNIAHVNSASKKKMQLLEEVISDVISKNSGVVSGYTKENRKQMRDLYNIK